MNETKIAQCFFQHRQSDQDSPVPHRFFRLLMVSLCLASQPCCGAMEEPLSESAFGFARRVFSATETKDVAWLLDHSMTTEGPGRREALEKSLTEWLSEQKKFGWILTVLSEHGDNLKKMIVLKQGDHIDPLFVIRKDESSPWKLVILDEDALLGPETVVRLREIFHTIDKDFRKSR